MMSLRLCMRSAPRLLTTATRVARPQVSLLRSSPILSATWKSTPRAFAPFSTSVAHRDAASDDLAAQLKHEREYEENESNQDEAESLPKDVQDYLDSSEFQLTDKAGSDEVVLSRQYENENISVTFSIVDLVDEADPDAFDNQAMYDEEDLDIADGQSGGANTKGATNGAREGSAKAAPEAEHAEEEYPESETRAFPARVTIKVERPNKGAISIEATITDGSTLIENVYYYSEAELADPQSADKDWARRDVYTGPRFSSLDPALQTKFEEYLEERGINTRMATFIPEYIDYKEAKEYARWLGNMESFFTE